MIIVYHDVSHHLPITAAAIHLGWLSSNCIPDSDHIEHLFQKYCCSAGQLLHIGDLGNDRIFIFPTANAGQYIFRAIEGLNHILKMSNSQTIFFEVSFTKYQWDTMFLKACPLPILANKLYTYHILKVYPLLQNLVQKEIQNHG